MVTYQVFKVIRSKRAKIDLETNITQNCLSMFAEIPRFFFLISRKRSSYLKNIWVHFINITVKTQKKIASQDI